MADLDPGVVLGPITIAAMERLSVTVQGRDWPATLGDFTLVGPVNNQGACRWYERRHHDGTIEHIKVDHQLQPLKPMSTDPSITPPPELVGQWRHSWLPSHGEFVDYMTTRAAQWGADMELEACVELTRDNDGYDAALSLRAARRPKPTSLKEQLLQKLEHIRDVADKYQDTQDAIDDLRETLEALDD
jgi:hypothetical protein